MGWLFRDEGCDWAGMGAAIRLRNAAFHRWRVQLGVGVGRVAVAAATAAEHHVAAGHRALVHFAQMYG